MTTNKPEAVGFATHHDEPMLFPDRKEASAYCDDGEEPVALIRLSDYQRLQADHERLQAEFTRELQRRFDGNEQASREHRAEVRVLVEALERIANMDSMSYSYHSLDTAKITARAAIAAYRKQGGNQ